MVNSSTYRHSSEPKPEYASKDPANRLLAHANLRRLEFEPLRDAVLKVSGALDLTVGGKPFDLSAGTHRSDRKGLARVEKLGAVPKLSVSWRRSVYGFIDREDLLEMLNTFDFANPSICSGRRYETMVPQQALFLMNSPLVIEQARRITERTEFLELKEESARVRFLYQLMFQRDPTPSELSSGIAFVAQWSPAESNLVPTAAPLPAGRQRLRDRRPAAPAPKKALSGWAEYAHALMMTTEMSFVR